MILKTCRWKSKNFSALINYILTDKGRIKNKDEYFTIYHNLPSIEPSQIATAYHQNDRFRAKKKNAKVTVYHEILSFSSEDRDALTLDKLEDITNKYVELRNPNALCLSKAHIENDNIHIHFMFSGTEYKSQNTLRMDNKTFAELRQNIEQYQIEKYPEISHSIVYTNKPTLERKNSQKQDQNTRKEKVFQMKRRVGEKKLDKHQLGEIVQNCFNSANTYSKFLSNLKQHGLDYYEYRGKIKGIIHNRKYRFSTLGIDKEQLKSLETKELNVSSRVAELQGVYERKKTGLTPHKEKIANNKSPVSKREQELLAIVQKKMRESQELDRK